MRGQSFVLSVLYLPLKTCSDQILPKLINQGVAAALLSSRRPKNLQNEKIFLCLNLKIAEIDMGVQLWVENNDPRHKN